MEREQLEEMGPIDYVVLEWPGQQPVGEAAPLILDAVDRGIIRILDVALLAKDSDGSIHTLELGALNGGDARGFAAFEGAQSGVIGEDDLEEAAASVVQSRLRVARNTMFKLQRLVEKAMGLPEFRDLLFL